MNKCWYVSLFDIWAFFVICDFELKWICITWVFTVLQTHLMCLAQQMDRSILPKVKWSFQDFYSLYTTYALFVLMLEI